jgi:predicted TIM-barrel fold metal-dependent hydrolase
MRDVDFRVGANGRLELTSNDVDYWLQWLPPSSRDTSLPPETMLAHMDYVGVDKAVLCPTHIYGELNQYTAQCVALYPDRFLGLASIREWLAFQPYEIDRLTHAVEGLSLSGLHFATEAMFMTDFQDDWSGPKYQRFWQEVRRLRIPVFWDIFSWGDDPWGQWEIEVGRLTRWAQRNPDIPSLVTHGLPLLRWHRSDISVQIPEIVRSLFRLPNIFIEVMLPGQIGFAYDYPFEIARPLLKALYDELDSTKFIWGSDMPTVERVVTYRQSLEYLKHCDFLTEEDRQRLLGKNAERLLASAGRVTAGSIARDEDVRE